MIKTTCLLAVLYLGWSVAASAQAPGVVHYQGRILVGTSPFDGTGQFKFALVNSNASQTYWLNAPDGNGDGEPDQTVAVAVARGLYAVNLGDSTVANMAAIPLKVFTDRIGDLTGDPILLRVWFNDGGGGFQRLSPDQRIGAVSFAMAAVHAETVADSSITARKFAPGALQANLISGTLDPTRLPANVALVSTSPADAALLGAGYVSFINVPAPPWMNGSSDQVPSPRSSHAAIWAPGLGQMFVWGGQLSADSYTAAGGLYRPEADAWLPVPAELASTPEARRGHTMIWDGNAAFVWGGFSGAGFLNTGGRFHPGTFSWTALAALNAPVARDGHNAVWLPPFMVVWGGRNSSGLRNDGALYRTANDQWSALALANPPAARAGASAVVATDRILVWGGSGEIGALNTGAQLVFQLTPTVTPIEWRTISTANAPAARTAHTAVMAGPRMIVWGGRNGGTLFGDGSIYDPANDTWQSLTSTGAPSPRSGHVAVWTGEEMVVFGGETASGSTATGGAYNPSANRWRSLTSAGSPVPRSGATVAWTGSELVVFGGQSGALPLAALQRLTPQPAWYFYRKP